MRCRLLIPFLALALLNGCTLLHREPETPAPPASLQLLEQADQAWRAMDFPEARRLYGMIIESFDGDPNRQEALLRLAMLEVVRPGEGPDVKAARRWLDSMDEGGLSDSQAIGRESLEALLDLYGAKREATRMLAEQNHRLEAQLSGREVEAIRQRAALYQWRRDVSRANDRVVQLEVELEKIRQEIKLLKDIDMMLQTKTGDRPSPSGTVPPGGDDK